MDGRGYRRGHWRAGSAGVVAGEEVWSELEDGTPVQISETVTATIGYNAFAALAPAIA